MEPGRFGPIAIGVFDGASPTLQGILASIHEEAKLWGLAGAKGIALLTERILGVAYSLRPKISALLKFR